MNLKNMLAILNNETRISIACDNGTIFAKVADVTSLLSNAVMNSVVTNVCCSDDVIKLEVKDFSIKHEAAVPTISNGDTKKKNWRHHPHRELAMDLLRTRYKKYGGDLTLDVISMMSGVCRHTLWTYTKVIENEAA